VNRLAIVTGATSGYVSLLEELLLNLSHLSVHDKFDVHVFDIDFTPEQADLIRRFPVNLRRIESDPLPISCPDTKRHHLISTIRPRLRDVFRGYDIYVYLDVDVWLQDRIALEGLVSAAEDKALVLVPESPSVYGASIKSPWQRKHERFYGNEIASRMTDRMTWNGGVLALHADSPAWDVWASEYQAVIERTGEWFGGAQSAFTYLDMIEAIRIRSLPVVYNWLVAYAPPHWDSVAGCFVSPKVPHEKILLVHQNHKSKSRRFKVQLTDGGSVLAGYRYPDYLAMREGMTGKSPWWRRWIST
jgi:hypothetical protein